MSKVTIRDLRNHGGRVLERVVRGETLTVTRSGRAVAELRPLPARGLRAEALLDRWRPDRLSDAMRLERGASLRPGRRIAPSSGPRTGRESL